MSVLTITILVFSVLGALDKIIGNRFGIGKEFEKAFMLLGSVALSIIGMVVISPMIAEFMQPLSQFLANTLHIDPSIIPASLFAIDMGGASLSAEMSLDNTIGMFNGLVVSSMMGCTLSFTIPFAFGVVGKEQHRELLLGLLCGIATIPTGCIVSGLMCKIPFVSLLLILMPLVIFSGIIAFGILKFPEICMKIFKIFSVFITMLITAGLMFGIINFLSGKEIIKGLATMEEGVMVCVNTVIVLSGAFPFIYILSKLLFKPLKFVGEKIGVNENSIVGIVSSFASSAPAFGMMEKMDKKGAMFISAFSISGAFVLGSHLAFTMAFNGEYIAPVVVGKLVSGILSLFLADIVFKKMQKQIVTEMEVNMINTRKPYAIFMDIDGTLLGTSKEALKQNLNMIKKVRSLGHKVFISTGRAVTYLPTEFSLKEHFDGIVAAAGGHVIVNEKELLKSFQPYDVVKKVSEFFVANNVNAALEGEDNVFFFNDTGTYKMPEWIKINKNNLNDVLHEGINIYKFLIVGALPKGLAELLGEEYTIMEHSDYCEIVSVGCDKARGIELILEKLRIPKERSVAIGDSLNDLGMIEYAEIGVAMGNAIDVIKENADLITDFVDNAGVAKALGKIFNIKL